MTPAQLRHSSHLYVHSSTENELVVPSSFVKTCKTLCTTSLTQNVTPRRGRRIPNEKNPQLPTRHCLVSPERWNGTWNIQHLRIVPAKSDIPVRENRIHRTLFARKISRQVKQNYLNSTDVWFLLLSPSNYTKTRHGYIEPLLKVRALLSHNLIVWVNLSHFK